MNGQNRFIRKNAPSVNLDAVFGLLVDGSASMLDKLDETKQAVLLFHDVLRQLGSVMKFRPIMRMRITLQRKCNPMYLGLCIRLRIAIRITVYRYCRLMRMKIIVTDSRLDGWPISLRRARRSRNFYCLLRRGTIGIWL